MNGVMKDAYIDDNGQHNLINYPLREALACSIKEPRFTGIPKHLIEAKYMS